MKSLLLLALALSAALPQLAHAITCFHATSSISVVNADGTPAQNLKGEFSLNVDFNWSGTMIDPGQAIQLNSNGYAIGVETTVCTPTGNDTPSGGDPTTARFNGLVPTSKGGYNWSCEQDQEEWYDRFNPLSIPTHRCRPDRMIEIKFTLPPA